MMEYKGYTAQIEFDEYADVLHGRVINLRDAITFEARSIDELWIEFKNSVDDYLEFCAERGEEPEKPFSGKFVVRVAPDLHRRASVTAARLGLSLNAWVTEALDAALAPPPLLQAHSRSTWRAVRESWVRLLEPEQTHVDFPSASFFRSTPVRTTEQRWDYFGAMFDLGGGYEWPKE